MTADVAFIETADGVTIAHARSGHGPVVVLVRGWITHLEMMWTEPEFRQFAEQVGRAATLIRYDGRGNGLAARDVEPPSFDELILDLEAVMDDLDLQDATLWGSSYGGPIAVAYAARHPHRVKRLVLEGTFATQLDAHSPSERATRRELGRLIASAPELAATAISYMTDPHPVTRHERRAERILAGIEPAMLQHLYALAARIDVRPLLASITVPTTVLHRRESRIFPLDGARRLADGIPGARLIVLDGVEHNLWEGPSDEALETFLEAIGAPLLEFVPGAGIMTLLMTDLVDSTGILDRLGDARANTLREEHDRLLRQIVRRHGGRVVKSTGDGMLAYFGRATLALTAATDAQRALAARNEGADVVLPVRMGLSAGEPLDVDDDLFGTVVHLAARVCGHADGGEVLVTEAVRGLVMGKGFTFDDRGDVDLRGFPQPVRLFAVR